MRPFLFFALLAPLARTGLAAEDCKLETYDEYTDDSHWSASSDRGVPGDVVAVDFTLHIQKLHTRPIAVVLVGCYDDESAELLGEPSYSEVYDRIFVGAFVNWLVIHWQGGINPDILPVETTVEPLTIREGLLKLAAPREFIRGDWDGDGSINLTDAKATLLHLYVSGEPPPCPDAADANDDGKLNLTDPINVLQHLFLGGPPLPAPYPAAGKDPTPDSIRC